MTSTVRFTYHDYLLVPDERRAEIIDGDLIREPSPGYGHQLVVKNLLRLLDRHVGLLKPGVVLQGPLDVILSDEDIVLPDIIYISRERYSIIRKNIHGAPDLVVEVLSPRDAARDRELKMKLYAKYGVKEYWLADPQTETVEVYALRRGLPWEGAARNKTVYYELHGLFGDGNTVTSRVLPAFEAKVDEMFAKPF